MIRREVPIFLVVGGLTVVIDFIVYHGLLWMELFNISVDKGISFLAGSLFAYVANRFWTFGYSLVSDGSIFRFILLYLSTLIINVAVNNAKLQVMVGIDYSLHISFIIATGVSAALNFIGMKLFVFK